MRIRPEQRQFVSDVCREEMHKAIDRVNQRLHEVESQPVTKSEDDLQTVRRLYEELADKAWAEPDEECLKSLPQDLGCNEIKRLMRESFRHSSVIPIPSFAYLIALSKRMNSEETRHGLHSRNPDALSAAERERLANLLEERLQEAAETIVKKLALNEARAATVRDELDLVQSQIVGQFTPLA
jgi:hypothetical protein